MRVLHLLNSDRLSGAENVVVEIINGFDGEVEMAYASPQGPIQNSLMERNVKYIPLKGFSIKEIRKIVLSYNPDIIHAHDIRASIQAVRVSKKIPVISHLHGNHDDMKKITLKSVLYMLASIRLEHIIGVSKSVINEYVFLSKIKNKSSVLYNIINYERIQEGVKSDSNLYHYDFVYLGRLSEPKNPKRIAKIASMVLKKVGSAKFAVIGDGNMVREMKEIFASNKVNDRVCFYGFMNNPYKILSQAKVMIMCSRYEGTPMAALEALSLGVPIISTPTDGLIELIENGVNGYIVDDDSLFTERVSEVITQYDIFSCLSEGAKEKSQDYIKLVQYKNSLSEIYNKSIKKS